MLDTSLSNQIHCQQCAAVLPVEQGTQFVTCPYCGTTNFVDKTQAVFHYAVRPTVQAEAALAALRRWMAGNATVKDLDQKATIEPPTFEYFPMWLVRAQQGEQERLFLEPAAAMSVSVSGSGMSARTDGSRKASRERQRSAMPPARGCDPC